MAREDPQAAGITAIRRKVRAKRLRDHLGRFRRSSTPLERFLAKCEFDPNTGCVVWIGGKTRGRGKTAWYGSFWFEGKRWTAHRWSAKHILGLEIDGMDVDHCCPHTNSPNTLCVRHLQAVTGRVNTELYWIRVQVGLEPEPDQYQSDPEGAIPFFSPPDWFPSDPPPVEPPF